MTRDAFISQLSDLAGDFMATVIQTVDDEDAKDYVVLAAGALIVRTHNLLEERWRDIVKNN